MMILWTNYDQPIVFVMRPSLHDARTDIGFPTEDIIHVIKTITIEWNMCNLTMLIDCGSTTGISTWIKNDNQWENRCWIYSFTLKKLVKANKNDIQPVFDYFERWTAPGISWALVVSLLTLYRWKWLTDMYTIAPRRLKCDALNFLSTKTTTNPFHSIRHLWHLHRFRRLFHAHQCVCSITGFSIPDALLRCLLLCVYSSDIFVLGFIRK